MKNLDIEKLERQNVYRVPDRFFEEMQMKVLAETAPKKEAKIIKMNWAYSAAASIALLFGVTFFVNQKNTDTEVIAATKQIVNDGTTVANVSLPSDSPQKEAVISDQNVDQDLTNVVATNQKESKAPNVIVEQNKNKMGDQEKMAVVQNPDVQVDQILANFSSADLADLGKNVEQDVYLDLYN
ncbi:hypothetical protein [Kaistella jeonii]|uniref:Uncharacterized protein n=1 Tax=Kaistella jeonii TaxID=266749 RepID=A0A0C1FQI3_9FLAO|nr:hypothetical protein [Kaistella jeonii]KIA90124.1 hypothetical protein OA86_05925 [Kaistella jeonii]SFB77385.1 hypothetical protein SAMN05421876_102101 [Kaistella jeonii]VEI96406.1 Uncharacterised protein [Kaistella jeonii]